MDLRFRRRSRGEKHPPVGAIGLRHCVEGVLVALGFAALAAALLHPWFSDPTRTVASLSKGGASIEAADVNLVMWILSWDWHALTTDPLRLFDANIFYPALNTLASSEHLLGHLAIYGPTYGLSGNPVLAYQVNYLANLALMGAGFYALLRHWSLSRGAAFFGGVLYVFFPFRMHLANYPHLFAAQYAPLALLFLDRTLLRGRVLDAVAFGLLLLLQMLCSYYLAYFTLVALVGYGVGVVVGGASRLRVRGVILAGLAALFAGAAFAAVSAPYLASRSTGAMPAETELRLLKLFSMGPWWDFFDRGNFQYVGVAPLLFAVVGFLAGGRVAGPVPWIRAAAAGLALACYTMAFGPEREISGRTMVFPYTAVMHVVPGFSSMRAPIRFLLMAQLGFAALSGMGFELVLRPLRRRFGAALAAAVVLAVTAATVVDFGILSMTRRTREVPAGDDVPAVYQQLAKVPRGPLLEVPSNHFFGHFRGAVVASWYMYFSTLHWQPLIDGYSGYAPPSAQVTRGLVAAMPDAKALRLLQRTTGLRYVAVHRDQLPDPSVMVWHRPPGFRQIGRFRSTDLLFEVLEEVEPDLMAELIDFDPRSTTLLGTPLQPLSEDERAASVQATYGKKTAVGAHPLGVEVTITNQSSAVWPSLAPVGDHLVTLAYRWERKDGTLLGEEPNAARLAYDLEPGETVRQHLAVVAPLRGEALLIVGLVQDGEWFPATADPIAVSVRSAHGLAGLQSERAAELFK